MQLTAIFGPPGAGKAGQVVETVLEQRHLPGGAYLVVPGPVDRSRYLRELSAREPMLLDVEVGTWSGLVQRLAAAPARRSDAVLERVVVRDALMQVPELAAAQRYAGFIDTAREVVADIRMAEAWGERELARVLAAVPGGDPASWRQLARRFAELLAERRLHDDAWFEARAARRIACGEVAVGAVVAVDHAVPAGIRVQLVERLAQRVPVTVVLPWRPGRQLHDAASRLRDRWTGSTFGGVVVRNVVAEASDGAPILDWLANELFEPSPSPAPPVASLGTRVVAEREVAIVDTLQLPLEPEPGPDGAPGGLAPIGFIDCCGRAQELEETVRSVARLVAAGVDPGAIAVTSARIGPSSERIVAGLGDAGIAASAMVRRHAPDTRAGRALLDLVCAVAGDDPRRLVAALAGSVVPVGSQAVRRADLALRGAPSAASIAAALDIREVAVAVPAAVVLLVQAQERGDGVLAAVRAVIAMLRPRTDGDLRLLTGLANALEALAAATGSERGVLLDDVVARIERHQLEVPDRTDSGTVLVASIADLGSLRVDAIVAFGFDDATFRASAEEDFDVPAAARDLLHLAVSRPRRALRIVRRAAGDDGGMVAPHPAWRELDRLARLAPAAAVERRVRRLGEVVVPPADVVLASERAVAVAIARSGGAEVCGVEPAVDASILEARFEPADEALSGPALESVAGMTRIAATELEAWSRCPAQWLLGRELGVRNPDESRTGMVAGSYAHGLLERMAPALHDRGTAAAQDEAWAELRAARDAARADADPQRILEQHDVDRVELQVVETIVAEHGGDWHRPDAILTEVAIDSRRGSDDPEVARAARGTAPPWPTRGLDVDGVEVHGRIDRIDVHGSEAVLHDYKSGSTFPSPQQLVARHSLQLPLYWLALERNPDAPNPVAAVYRKLRDGGALAGLRSVRLKDLGMLGSRDRPPKDEVVRGILDEADSRAREILDGMRSGSLATDHVDPTDARGGPCGHCSFAGTCRIDDRHRARLAAAMRDSRRPAPVGSAG